MSHIAKAAALIAGTGALLAGSAGLATADSGAHGETVKNPGVISGNAIQVPIHIPINLCGNSVNIVGLLNPAFGNACANISEHGAYGH
ncbi:hypothetical protein AR457_13575 [Streptomyces agglomeratus]|uniref:Chaplin domain-containing protein n=1 Tax=Streptomyces agglomeratus TaxID=285458 RepID=A0A1E5P734_9ACTN|nr:chaplin [Streptomyces agglomeratus]OEJ25340.1 hypothetical protein AS594_13405 [Streptomyces agglomeratus]OEJ40624.1 hypothetical protein BGK70_23075 [Streptomyces agglomeratus]OEJ44995.1 hypothetical protein AR457_13575 [Streptomyces agglomeratus]OEJ53171.1 hypothetical protein BGK72_22695 [Streptomyces agglomeratus]OEJ60508.1 hypothetical protein BGM19_23405 [Streptomyces agglomeratus]